MTRSMKGMSSETEWESFSEDYFQTRLKSTVVHDSLRSNQIFVNTFLFVKP